MDFKFEFWAERNGSICVKLVTLPACPRSIDWNCALSLLFSGGVAPAKKSFSFLDPHNRYYISNIKRNSGMVRL
ncbi:hypothetical protein CEXT_496171 [Caerostris extrusa]|uniref:Uncharacterized protein n=1 Tax=Caerostris extrusa TaxID=172846 RepID=A0AAV4QUR4_CAEEX|nr:hypothetical protein CEXT_496171 [Caerostris extrusa]